MAVELGDLSGERHRTCCNFNSYVGGGFADNPALRSQLEEFHPTGSIGDPEDVARVVLFLLDPKQIH